MRLGQWINAVVISIALLMMGTVVAGPPAQIQLAQTEEADQPDSSWKPLGLIREGVGNLAGKLGGGGERGEEGTDDGAGEAPAPSASGDRIFSSDPLPLDWVGEFVTANPKLAAELGIAEIDWEGLEGKNLEGTLQLRDGRIEIVITRLEVGPGRITGSLTLDPTTTPLTVSLELLANDINIEDLRRENTSGLLTDGTLDMKLRLSGRGESMAALMASAEGGWDLLLEEGRAVSGKVETTGGPLFALDLVGALIPPGLNAASIRCAVTRVVFEAGVARPEVLVIVTEHTLITGTGSVDLGREAIDLMLIPQESSNVQGVLLPPMKIGGSLAAPTARVAPLGNLREVGSIGRLIASPVITPILAVSGEKHDCAQELKNVGAGQESQGVTPPPTKAATQPLDGG